MDFISQIPPLTALIGLPLIFAFINALLPQGERPAHSFNIIASLCFFTITFFLWLYYLVGGEIGAEIYPWFPQFGINFHLAADGISWILVVLTTLLVTLSMGSSYSSIHKRPRLYYAMIWILTASILGVFLARDLFSFLLFWELELIPMYLLIAIWGGTRREYAAVKFVLYTLFGSVFMFAAALGLFFVAKSTLHINTFDFAQLQQVAMHAGLGAQILMFLGFFLAFAIKLPMVPFHTWLPDAHVEAPTPVSMLLAGILLKMGSYGMLRFCFSWFPDAAVALAPYLVLMGAINIVYTAGVALVQADLKKLIAYSSVSHMGFVLLGLGALNAPGFNGAMFQMVSHGLISAGLFMMVGVIYNQTHTRQIAEMGGFGRLMPKLYFFSIVIAMASLGLPLLGGFPAETLVFYGAFLSKAFSVIPWFGGGELALSIQTLTVISALGVVIGAAYLLWMLQRVFTGPVFPKWEGLKDCRLSESWVLASLCFLIFAVGLFPSWVNDRFEPDVTAIARTYDKQVEAPKNDFNPLLKPELSNATSAEARSTVAMEETH